MSEIAKQDSGRGNDIPAIERMRAIAANSGDRLYLSDGPVHSDHELLGMCGDALHHLVQAKRINWTDAAGRHAHEEYDRAQTHLAAAVQLMRRAKKFRATTTAGIFAKAMLVRASATGASVLAKSMAEDLVANSALRESLWQN